jgi:hypothetical protein
LLAVIDNRSSLLGDWRHNHNLVGSRGRLVAPDAHRLAGSPVRPFADARVRGLRVPFDGTLQ